MTTGVDIARLQRGLVLCASCSLRARAQSFLMKKSEEDFLIVFSPLLGKKWEKMGVKNKYELTVL
tara:strand:+ start:613 stop:807 length:195 start_codon:yes stop_codon:yes gene_type:complete